MHRQPPDFDAATDIGVQKLAQTIATRLVKMPRDLVCKLGEERTIGCAERKRELIVLIAILAIQFELPRFIGQRVSFVPGLDDVDHRGWVRKMQRSSEPPVPTSQADTKYAE